MPVKLKSLIGMGVEVVQKVTVAVCRQGCHITA
jgi:hypothetical protein